MRRNLGVALALALASAGCSSKNNQFDPTDNGGNGAGAGAGGTTAATTANASTTGTAGSSGTSTGTSTSTTSSSGSSGSTGLDAGPCGDLTGAQINLSIVPQALALSAAGTLTIVGQYANSFNAALCPITVIEQSGEGFLINISDNALTLDSSGKATDNITSLSVPGVAHIVVTLGPVSQTLAVQIGQSSGTDGGTPVASSIEWVSTTPASGQLGVTGSGQERGSMAFEVFDQFASPMNNVQVDFVETGAGLLAIAPASSVTASNGQTTAQFNALTQVGVTAVQATVHGTSVSTSHPIVVHAGRPSAGHFAFTCDKYNIPVYTTIAGIENVTCHVSLGDRYGNRIDTPTTVSFYAETGSIQTSVTLDGGEADVSYTTNVAAGFAPVDVAPLVANAGQFPVPLVNDEPSYVFGAETRNPRDQVVTLIALTQGEEQFTDANGNNQFDPGSSETFVDLGDPFVDANDNNVYDAVLAGGQGEQKVGSVQSGNDGGYHVGNGVWDANATIWTSVRVVYTDTGTMSTRASNATTAEQFNDGGCLQFGESSTINLYTYDTYLNPPGLGTTYTVQLSGSGPTINTNLTNPLDNNGAVIIQQAGRGVYPVASSNGQSCQASNGQACTPLFEFEGFTVGNMGTITATNSTSPPAALTDGGPGPSHCTTFVVNLNVAGPNGSATSNSVQGTYEVTP